jgi:hypothetical protein
VTRFKPIQEGIEPLVVEPAGYGPFLCYVLDDEKVEVDQNLLEQQRLETVKTYTKLLGQVKSKIQSSQYGLDKWKRVLAKRGGGRAATEKPKKPARK